MNGSHPQRMHNEQLARENTATMSNKWYLDDDRYEAYADEFDRMNFDRQARRKRKRHANHEPKKSTEEVLDEIADTVGLEGGFETTYQPSKYEAGWLLKSLETLYDQQLITDVLAQIKGGKEGSVYCCVGHESTGTERLAAKVYRPRMFRQLRNDKMYREGREVIMNDGTRINDSDFREMRAITKGTGFGRQVMHASWLMHEYKTLQLLHDAGAAVPKVWAVGDNVILMDYIGTAEMAAPTLNTVRLGPDEAERLFDDVLRNVRLMLQHRLIHGDLSAYNVLYDAGSIVLIDFPQVTEITSNTNAHYILRRDITRICEYFAEQGVERNPASLAEELWFEYGYGDLY